MMRPLPRPTGRIRNSCTRFGGPLSHAFASRHPGHSFVHRCQLGGHKKTNVSSKRLSLRVHGLILMLKMTHDLAQCMWLPFDVGHTPSALITNQSWQASGTQISLAFFEVPTNPYQKPWVMTRFNQLGTNHIQLFSSFGKRYCKYFTFSRVPCDWILIQKQPRIKPKKTGHVKLFGNKVSRFICHLRQLNYNVYIN